jgi:hypothetical protein
VNIYERKRSPDWLGVLVGTMMLPAIPIALQIPREWSDLLAYFALALGSLIFTAILNLPRPIHYVLTLGLLLTFAVITFRPGSKEPILLTVPLLWLAYAIICELLVSLFRRYFETRHT